MIKAMRCARCGSFAPMGNDGVLKKHHWPGGGEVVCTGHDPVPSSLIEYPVGFDSEPRWVMNGGLPTLGKGHR